MAATVGPCDEADQAGRSAQAAYERSYAAWRSSRVPTMVRWVPLALIVAFLGAWYLTATTGIRLFGVLFAMLVLGAVGDVLFRPSQALRDLKHIAAGERATGRLLNRARRDGYHVLHDRTVGGRVDIEHLLAGPGGLFLLDSKNWAEVRDEVRVLGGKLWVGRESQADMLARVRGHADEVAREMSRHLDPGTVPLPIAVIPAVVVHGIRVSGTPRMIGGVAVLEPSQVLNFLARAYPVWDSGQARRVATVAERVLPLREAAASGPSARRPGWSGSGTAARRVATVAQRVRQARETPRADGGGGRPELPGPRA
jgi:hypothetical protein